MEGSKEKSQKIMRITEVSATKACQALQEELGAAFALSLLPCLQSLSWHKDVISSCSSKGFLPLASLGA